MYIAFYFLKSTASLVCNKICKIGYKTLIFLFLLLLAFFGEGVGEFSRLVDRITHVKLCVCKLKRRDVPNNNFI